MFVLLTSLSLYSQKGSYVGQFSFWGSMEVVSTAKDSWKIGAGTCGKKSQTPPSAAPIQGFNFSTPERLIPPGLHLHCSFWRPAQGLSLRSATPWFPPGRGAPSPHRLHESHVTPRSAHIARSLPGLTRGVLPIHLCPSLLLPGLILKAPCQPSLQAFQGPHPPWAMAPARRPGSPRRRP